MFRKLQGYCQQSWGMTREATSKIKTKVEGPITLACKTSLKLLTYAMWGVLYIVGFALFMGCLIRLVLFLEKCKIEHVIIFSTLILVATNLFTHFNSQKFYAKAKADKTKKLF